MCPSPEEGVAESALRSQPDALSTTQVSAKPHTPRSHASRSRLSLLCLTAMGVVYGDIGTSPLYALRECFFGHHAVPVTSANILGVLSLIVWTLIVVVTLKYHVYVLRADNRGEGGILALLSLVRDRESGTRQLLVTTLGLFGAALLYGDGILTPAISVLSAIEGLEVATPLLAPFVVPLTIGILVGLFLFQRKGTAAVGAVFGPVIVAWFAILALLGVSNIVAAPEVLRAVNPMYAVEFLYANGMSGYLVLGAVFLVTTGGEALYADLGHFGDLPIQIDWFAYVGPSLLLNYFGQGALLLHDPSAASNPFYLMAPTWALYPLVVLAAMASVIASQAVISGVFSLTRQAVQLGFAPRVDILHTSSLEIGQIYIPGANWMLMAGTVALVLAFQSSTHLAAAYGVAVATTMTITTMLAFVVTQRLWHWPLWASLLVTLTFLLSDLAFFGANIVKVAQGGWIPIAVGLSGFFVFLTWHRGRELQAEKIRKSALPLSLFVADLQSQPIRRVPGTAVFLNSSAESTPIALLHNLKLNHVVHEQNLVVTIVTEEIPFVSIADRFSVETLGAGFTRLVVRYGFMEDPDLPAALAAEEHHGLRLNPAQLTYILSNNTVRPGVGDGMSWWRKRFFSFLSRNAQRPPLYFRLPLNRVIELGMQIDV